MRKKIFSQMLTYLWTLTKNQFSFVNVHRISLCTNENPIFVFFNLPYYTLTQIWGRERERERFIKSFGRITSLKGYALCWHYVWWCAMQHANIMLYNGVIYSMLTPLFYLIRLCGMQYADTMFVHPCVY